MSWHDHVVTIAKTASQKLRLLYTPEQLLLLYKKHSLKLVDTIQKIAVRLIDTTILTKDLHSLEHRRFYRGICSSELLQIITPKAVRTKNTLSLCSHAYQVEVPTPRTSLLTLRSLPGDEDGYSYRRKSRMDDDDDNYHSTSRKSLKTGSELADEDSLNTYSPKRSIGSTIGSKYSRTSVSSEMAESRYGRNEINSTDDDDIFSKYSVKYSRRPSEKDEEEDKYAKYSKKYSRGEVIAEVKDEGKYSRSYLRSDSKKEKEPEEDPYEKYAKKYLRKESDKDEDEGVVVSKYSKREVSETKEYGEGTQGEAPVVSKFSKIEITESKSGDKSSSDSDKTIRAISEESPSVIEYSRKEYSEESTTIIEEDPDEAQVVCEKIKSKTSGIKGSSEAGCEGPLRG
nr:unnamed protein product [Callosobruchus analis]